MAADSLLTLTQQEELLSRAYAHAVASRAGYVTAVYESDLDGVDMRIQAGGDMRPAVELQLKATINLGDGGDHVRFPLKRRNYELLRKATQTPRLLVVLELPNHPEQWMDITADELVIRHRAYWISLLGYEKTTNQCSVTVHIPKQNRFDVTGLQLLIERSRKGMI